MKEFLILIKKKKKEKINQFKVLKKIKNLLK